jgi:hypothetical protein
VKKLDFVRFADDFREDVRLKFEQPEDLRGARAFRWKTQSQLSLLVLPTFAFAATT